MLDWLRRLICQCPESEPTIQVTGRTLHSLDYREQLEAEGSIAPGPPGWPPMWPHNHMHIGVDAPTMTVQAGGEIHVGGTGTPAKPTEPHLRLVEPDDPEPDDR